MKPPKSETKEFDGLKFTTTQLPAMSALLLEKRLIPIVAPVFASMRGIQVDDEGAVTGGELGDVSGFGRALEALDEAAFTKLMLQILAGTTVVIDGEQRGLRTVDDINYVFSGRLGELHGVMWFAIQVNFFPTGVGAHLAAALKRKAASLST